MITIGRSVKRAEQHYIKALFTEGDKYIKPPPIPMRYLPMSRVVRVLFE